VELCHEVVTSYTTLKINQQGLLQMVSDLLLLTLSGSQRVTQADAQTDKIFRIRGWR